MYSAGLVLFPAYKKYPRLANYLKWAGLPLMAASLVAGSFAPTLPHLIATQGVTYAISGSIVFIPRWCGSTSGSSRRKALRMASCGLALLLLA